ncbi:MAG: hypothetical protein ACK5LO_15600 [Leucobacter sp.]
MAKSTTTTQRARVSDAPQHAPIYETRPSPSLRVRALIAGILTAALAAVGTPAFSSAAVADDAVPQSSVARTAEPSTSEASSDGSDTGAAGPSEEDGESEESTAAENPAVQPDDSDARPDPDPSDARAEEPAAGTPAQAPDDRAAGEPEQATEQRSEAETETKADAPAADRAAASQADAAATPSCRAGERLREAMSANRSGANTKYWYCEPEKTVVGQDIVIRGVGGYFALDGKKPSVIAFKVGPESSGHRNTLLTNRSVINPVNGEDIGKGDIHAAVRAKSDGTWEVRIPFPTDKNSEWLDQTRTDKVSQVWKPGTQHVVTMLSDQLLPGDTRRSSSAVINVVASENDVVVPKQPSYAHFTYAPSAAQQKQGDRAKAWLQKNVPAGSSARFTGTGWLGAEGMSGSRIEVRLVNEKGKPYKRTGDAVVEGDSTLWQVIHTGVDGYLDTEIEMPKGAKTGSYVAVQLRTSAKTPAGADTGDRGRSWTSAPLVIAGQPYVPPKPGGSSCKASPGKASYKLAPGMKTAAANIGGTIRLTGKNWCNLAGGGSLIAVKIDAGAYSHAGKTTAKLFSSAKKKEQGLCKAGICKTNQSIWYVIEADKSGSFDVRVPIPNRKNTTPKFSEGQYTLQLLTRTVAADPYYKSKRLDPSRTIKTKPFTVVGENDKLTNVKPGKPKAAADVLHARNDLRSGRKGGVKITQGSTAWVVKVPKAEPGEWVYVNVYDGDTARSPWGTQWFRVKKNGTVTVPLKGATLPSGRNKASVQDSEGKLLGWNYVTVAEPPSRAATSPSAPRTAVSGGQPRAAISSSPPEEQPAPPVKRYSELNAGNIGDLQVTRKGKKLTVTAPGVAKGDWVFLYLYTEPGASGSEKRAGKRVAVGWVQFGSDLSFTMKVGSLPPGKNKIALVSKDDGLVGWVTVAGAAAKGSGENDAAKDPELAEEPAAAGLGAGLGAALGGGNSQSMSLILMGISVLLLAGAAAGVISLRGAASGGAAGAGAGAGAGAAAGADPPSGSPPNDSAQ